MIKLSQDLSNKLIIVQFEQKLMKIEKIDFEQHTVISSMLHISKKMKFFNFRAQTKVGKKVVVLDHANYVKNSALRQTFERTSPKILTVLKTFFH